MSNSGKFQGPFPFLPFAYGAVQIREAGYIGTTPYFTRRAIGEWLEYQDPKSAISRIIKKNPHIENQEWAVVVNLTTTDGKKYDTHLYNPIGLQLIVFESRQPKAIEYKIAVARLVNDIMTGAYQRRVLMDIATGRMPLNLPVLRPAAS